MPHVSVSVNGIRQNGPRGRVYATTDVRPATRPSGATAFDLAGRPPQVSGSRPVSSGTGKDRKIKREATQPGHSSGARRAPGLVALAAPVSSARARRSGTLRRRDVPGPRAPRLTGRQIRKNITCTQDVPPCVERYWNLTALGHRRWTRLASHGARGCCLRSYRPPTYRSPLA